MAERGDIVELPEEPGDESDDRTAVSRVFKVVAGSGLDAKALLRDRRGVTRGVVYRSPYGEEIDASLICRGVRWEPVNRSAPLGGLSDYRLTARYDTRKAGGKEEAAIGGPPVYGLEASLVSVPVDVDAQGRGLVTSSMEPFDPPLSDTEAREIITAEWWVVAGSVEAALRGVRGLADSLNASEWLGAPRGSVFCVAVRKVDETAVEDGRVAVKFAARFEYRRPINVSELGVKVVRMGSTNALGAQTFTQVTGELEGFEQLRADRGRRTLKVVDSELTYPPIVLNKRVVSDPVDLDGAGQVLEDGERKVAIAVKLKRRYVDYASYGI